jgi:cytochrome c oxidase accessory protein FixG
VSVQPDIDTDSFRDNIATADKQGKRLWVYPVQPRGRLYRARTITAVFLLGILFAGPFLRIGGQPILLLDVLNRRFVIFGFTFWPQDIYLFVIATITGLVFIILFTAILGRLFCGWVCPQTVFMEMVFRRIEYWIEGGPSKQRQLSARSWDIVKIYKRLLKHAVFFAVSFLIGNVFLAYIIGADRLFDLVTDSPINHLAGFSAMLIFSFVFYFVFAWFREQACTLVCPYGRLQGVLLDSNSIQVAYDYKRGEPRKRITKGEDRAAIGDCVACNACVMVCPTGIDIRNGTQLECVNCTACIDACNRIMGKVGFRLGLIRYSSEDILKKVSGRIRLTGRIVIYSLVFTILVTLLTFLLINRTPVETTILRTPGTLYSISEDGDIRNLYSVKMINKTYDSIPVDFRLKAPPGGSITLVSSDILLPPAGIAETAIFVNLAPESLFGSSATVIIEVLNGEQIMEEITTSFTGPRRSEP